MTIKSKGQKDMLIWSINVICGCFCVVVLFFLFLFSFASSPQKNFIISIIVEYCIVT